MIVLGWIAGCAALVAGVAATPAMMGFDFGQALLWMPDLGRTMIAVIVLACALAITRVTAAVRDSRRDRR
jgi:hypothetical protein